MALSNVSSPGGSTVANAGLPFNLRVTDLSGFVQDDWKISSRLTVNLGVRWEYDGYPSETSGRMTNVWRNLLNVAALPGNSPATGTLAGFAVPSNYDGPLPAGLFKSSNSGPTPTSASLRDFAPRVGFAWQPMSSNRFVIRGGGGLFSTASPAKLSATR